mmetsp:Transcript_30837/g.37827  ORF Transcript_30837/g.37827 Transcript_30837/m.37827 type:complete len:106 (+) Transcript_30837:463-780(+)
MGPPRRSQIYPPMKGVFPLDHLKECRLTELRYLGCLKKFNGESYYCTHLVEDYLKCRMDKSLMLKQDMTHMGIDSNKKHPIFMNQKSQETQTMKMETQTQNDTQK